MKPAAIVIGLVSGKSERCWPGRPPSAIGKQPVAGPVRIDFDGIAGDEQADGIVHGGAEKALHHYAAEHHASWRNEFPDLQRRIEPGCFGENFSTTGVTEKDLRLGDVLSLGTAKVQICQGPQPCWKLNAHVGDDRMAARFQKTGWSGWYYRVLEGGEARTGEQMDLLQRPNPEWQLDSVIRAGFAPGLSKKMALDLSNLTELSGNWRRSFARKADRSYREETSSRLLGT